MNYICFHRESNKQKLNGNYFGKVYFIHIVRKENLPEIITLKMKSISIILLLLIIIVIIQEAKTECIKNNENKTKRNDCKISISGLGWFGLFWFYGIWTIVVYLMPNPFLYK